MTPWGEGKPTYIIAEIGINHNGDMDIAKKMIETAKKSGANAVKFQKRTIDEVYSQEELDSPRESPWGTTTRQQKEGLEFDAEQHVELSRYCHFLGIDYGVSPWDAGSATQCLTLNPSFIKVAAPMMTHTDILAVCRKAMHDRGTNVICSTGMSDVRIIERAIDHMYFPNAQNQLALLHCVSAYPTKTENANLGAIRKLKSLYPAYTIGYSGHEDGYKPSVWAVAMGAKIVERHFTTDRSMYGSDQRLSLDPFMFRMMVDDIRDLEKATGTGEISVQQCEMPAMQKLRRM